MVSPIDVVIPCFNAARYIKAAIDSVLSQPVGVSRVIVVDDGSTDASAEILGSFGPPVELISQAHAGICAARNAGISAATSEWLTFIDADDLWTLDSLSLRLDFLRQHPELDGVFAAVQNFASPELDAANFANLQIDLTPSTARFAGTLLIKRASFLRAGLFDTTLQVGEMIEWIARAEHAQLRLGTIPGVVMQRRIHDANTTRRLKQAPSAYLQAIKLALRKRHEAAAGPIE